MLELFETIILVTNSTQPKIFQACRLASFSAPCYYLFIIMKFIHGLILKAKEIKKQANKGKKTNKNKARGGMILRPRLGEIINSLTKHLLSLELKNTDKKYVSFSGQY